MQNKYDFSREPSRALLDQLLSQAPTILLEQFNKLNNETRKHCLRCANDMALSGITYKPLLQGALFHDIGKTMIPPNILMKKGPLTGPEWDIMKRHTLFAQQFFWELDCKSPEIRPIYEMAIYHHERWDGSGYPFGLRGEDIPTSARLMSIVDSFDAIQSKRCYKPSISLEETFNTIKHEAGVLFDPILSSLILSQWSLKI